MRYTETKLDKIVRIGMARIDQVFDKCCDDLEALKYRPSEEMERLKRDAISSLQANIDLQSNNRLEETARLKRLPLTRFESCWEETGATYEQMRGMQNVQNGLMGRRTQNTPSMWPFY